MTWTHITIGVQFIAILVLAAHIVALIRENRRLKRLIPKSDFLNWLSTPEADPLRRVPMRPPHRPYQGDSETIRDVIVPATIHRKVPHAPS